MLMDCLIVQYTSVIIHHSKVNEVVESMYKHGWFFYFHKKPCLKEVFPERMISRSNQIPKCRKSRMWEMLMFVKTCHTYRSIKCLLCSPGGGSKGVIQADQISFVGRRFVQHWALPKFFIDYCLSSVTLLSDFVKYLKKT